MDEQQTPIRWHSSRLRRPVSDDVGTADAALSVPPAERFLHAGGDMVLIVDAAAGRAVDAESR